MLSLSRRISEKIHVGESIVFTVTKIRGNQVTVLVEAPREIPIWRGERVEAVRRTQENQE